MLSGIQHFRFCRRQWALIHIEQQWAENAKTTEGNIMHKKADNPFVKEKRGEKIVARGMPIKSEELKLSGICDVVEFSKNDHGVPLHGSTETYEVFPVEYKRGKPKKDRTDILQLTAQAICLEEMLVTEVKKGYIYYGETKRREEVHFTLELRNELKNVASEMHDYFKRRYTPIVKTGKFCESCSLKDMCLPHLMNKESVRGYIERVISE
ncbi:CRISPR-associated protein Cas4 [Salimicrobium jeotgali]|nr:CRISPR-associated protein Cas4 [Salimicrobium jeotgali]